MLPTKLSIRKFFYLFLTCAVIVPLLIVGGISLYISSSILRKEIQESNLQRVSYYSDRIEHYLDTPKEFFNALVKQLESGLVEKEILEELIFKPFVESSDIILSIQKADDQGIIDAIYPPDELFMGLDISGHQYFKIATEIQEPYWSPSSLSEHMDAPVTSLSYYLNGFVITATLSLEEVTSLFEDQKFFDEGLILYVTDQKGVYIAHSEHEKVQLQEYDPRFIQYKREGFDSLPQTIEYKGIEYSVYSQIIESSNWMVTLLRPVSDINRPLSNMTISLIFLTILVIIAVLLFSAFPRRNLARPLAGLTKLTGKISLGDYALGDIPAYKIQELDELGRSISQMSEEIMNREKAFRNIRAYLYNVLDSMPSIIIGIDLDLDVTQWNHRAEEETGLPAVEAVGKNLLKVFPRLKQSSNLIKKSIYRHEMQTDTLRSYASSESKKVENLVIYPLTSQDIQGAVIRIDNVTEKTMMEETLIQNEKMLSVGGLAAGMAHEINNPLAGMVQTANVLSNRLGLVRKIPANEAAAAEVSISMDSLKQYMEKRDIPYMIESLNSSGKRIAGIINNMLSFVRSNDDGNSTYNVNDILDQSIELALTDYNLRKKYDFLQIKIVKEYGENLPGVVCEMSRIQQVFFNILQNGAHAMASNKEETPQFTLKTYFEGEQKMIVTEIIDNGPGMDESIRKRIFEPFFTTKPVGIGTGLGLSVSYFIITDNQNGQMFVESSPGQGAKFIIKLPVSSL